MTPDPQLVAAGVAGVLIHNLAFIHGEWHFHAIKVLKLHALAYIALVLLKATYDKNSWLAAAAFSPQLLGMYTLCLLGSISIYRVFFHRLRSFPGPVLASVSKFWHVAHCLDSKGHLLLERLHQQYGDFVRIGMVNLVL